MGTATIKHSFETLDQANAAVQALTEAGIAKDSVQVWPREDEAGPVSGNFAVGNGVTTDSGFDDPARPGYGTTYEGNFDRPRARGTVLLLAVGLDEEHERIARDVLSGQGGVDLTES
jgi:hypothetical protein